VADEAGQGFLDDVGDVVDVGAVMPGYCPEGGVPLAREALGEPACALAITL
jgi:hypothetical protein